jgi:hypothetical protein
MKMVLIVNKYLSDGRDFTFAWSMFLDAFYSAELDGKVEMFNEPAERLDLDQNTLAYIASSVHKLAREADLRIPAWVFDSKYFLRDPYFVGNPPDLLRLVYLAESPAEFKMRNVFSSENCLSRV